MRLESNYYRDVMLRLEDPKELADGGEKLSNEIDAMERQLFEVAPTGRNFEVKIKKDREIVLAVKLERADGYTVSLNTLLPENAHFCVASGFWCFNKTFSGDKLVTFPPNKLQYRGGLLSLTHEIGHAHQPDTISLSMAEDNNCEKQEKFHRVLAQRERGAWAFALRTLRCLQKDGFNVFDGFHSGGEVQEFITCNLLSYEIRRRSSLLELGGQLALDKARPLFVRGQLLGDGG